MRLSSSAWTGLWLAAACYVGAEEETPGIAPQCKSMDPDGTCVGENVIQDTTSTRETLESEEDDDYDENEEEEDDDENKDEEDDHIYPPTCGLYMAKSSIPNAGWGMYSNKEIQRGEDILPLDVVVHVYDLPEHVAEGDKSWLLSEYVWNPGKSKILIFHPF